MKLRYSLAVLFALAFGAMAQVPPRTAAAPSVVSALDAPLFHQLLISELAASGGDPGTGYSLTLDAARKTGRAQLYQRAIEMALQARAGDAALQAARAWQKAQPDSAEAHRQTLQLLLALNRLDEVEEALRSTIAATPMAERSATIAVLPRLFARVQDRQLAARLVEQALDQAQENPETAAAAWSTIGRLRLQAGSPDHAMDAARRGQAASPKAQAPALLALELMEANQPEAEKLVLEALNSAPLPELRLIYARALLDKQRNAEASAQLQRVTTDQPDLAQAWLVLGSLQAHDNQSAAAENSLRRFLHLASQPGAAEELQRGQTQAYLVLAQLAEKRRDFPAAEAWLDRIDNSAEVINAQTRRASILARQGKLEQARKLLKDLPERNPGDARMKLMAEIQLLRDNKQPRLAYDLLGEAMAREPRDTDLAYDRALLAEKLGLLDEMERLLRQVIAAKPDDPGAYNALGYSMADRNDRLPEARSLVEKARRLAPNDPFIQDSAAWVEYRLGNKTEALRLLEGAYQTRPDAEIAAHMGEVLWSLGQRDRAKAIWREGLLLGPDNDTLTETLRRLRVQP